MTYMNSTFYAYNMLVYKYKFLVCESFIMYFTSARKDKKQCNKYSK